jgi:hypothetical protein
MKKLLLLVLLVACSALLSVATADDADGGMLPPVVRIFEISGKGPVQHVHGPTLGAKSFVTKANKTSIPECITGAAGGACTLLANDPGGKAYLFIYTSRLWGIATTSDPATATITLLDGLTDGKGKFTFAGEHAATGTSLLVEGKAKLDKELGDDLIPLSVKGKVYAVSVQTEHSSKGGFATKGKPLGE